MLIPGQKPLDIEISTVVTDHSFQKSVPSKCFQEVVALMLRYSDETIKSDQIRTIERVVGEVGDSETQLSKGWSAPLACVPDSQGDAIKSALNSGSRHLGVTSDNAIHPVPVKATSFLSRMHPTGYLQESLPDLSLQELGRLETLSDSRHGFRFGALGVLLLLCATHGGIHLAAWDFDFPSDVERLLWRISGFISIAGSVSAPAALVVIILALNMPKGSSFFAHGREIFGGLARDSQRQPGCWKLFTVGIFWAGISMFPFFLAARSFLFTEAFWSLRRLPAGCYTTVDWVANLPHL